MGNDYCVHRMKTTVVYTEEEAKRAFSEHERLMKEKASMPVKLVKDTSDLAQFTAFEEQLNIRNVHLEEFENRLKQFVYKVQDNERKSLPQEVCTIKKQ